MNVKDIMESCLHESWIEMTVREKEAFFNRYLRRMELTVKPDGMIADNRPTQKLLYEGLVKYVDGEIQPVLAEDWELSEDGTQLTFYLQPMNWLTSVKLR